MLSTRYYLNAGKSIVNCWKESHNSFLWTMTFFVKLHGSTESLWVTCPICSVIIGIIHGYKNFIFGFIGLLIVTLFLVQFSTRISIDSFSAGDNVRITDVCKNALTWYVAYHKETKTIADFFFSLFSLLFFFFFPSLVGFSWKKLQRKD